MKRLLLPLMPLLLLLSACLKLPAPEVRTPATWLEMQGFSPDTLPYDIRWWEVFADTTLNALQEQALRDNRGLASAAARVESARRNLVVAQSAYLPSLEVGIEASAEHQAGVGTVQKYSVSPSISWEVSLFGALRATRQEARSAILSSEWAFRGVLLSLTAEVATTYFNYLAYRQNLEIAEQTTRLRAEQAALTDSLYYYGMESAVARDQARSLLYTAEADQAQYRRLAQQTLYSLQILLGEEPSAVDTRGWGYPLTEQPLPLSVPVGLPSDLLSRRPDVMEDLYSLDAAAARVGMARAARFPTLNLTGQGGVVAESVKDLTRGDPWVWSAAASLIQPVFAFGRLKAQERIAREAYMEALFGYEETILEALSEVEQALVGITMLRQEQERTAQLVAANEAIAQKSRALYENGMADYLDLLDAERSYYSSRTEWITLSANLSIGYVQLFKALGGGW